MDKFLFLNKKLSKGFTLIELLIVIAVIGVLAAVVLVAIDPVQQLARGRDAGRKSAVGQLGRATQAYYTVNTSYPTVTQWTAVPNILVSSGEIRTFPTGPVYSAGPVACTTNAVSTYCFNINLAATDVVIYARLEARADNNRCPVLTPSAWFVWSSADSRSGVVCGVGVTEPGPGSQVFLP